MKKNNKITHWRSLEEKNQNSSFLKECGNEFVEELPVNPTYSDNKDFSRRDFLKMMGFSVAGVLTACSRMPVEKAIPYMVQPENIVPGKAYWYASTCGSCTARCGILVKNREGRPIKIEGNAESPLNKGGLCASGQAGLLELYDSGRLQQPLINKTKSSYADADLKIKQILGEGGEVRYLSNTITSPTLRNTINNFLSTYNGKHIEYDPVSASALVRANKVLPQYRFDQAHVIVSLGADFLGAWISPVSFSKQYIKNRKLKSNKSSMSRHYQIESRLSLTGSNADERVSVKPSEIPLYTAAILHGLQKKTGGASNGQIKVTHSKLVDNIIRDLLANRGKSLVVSASNDINEQLAVAKINSILGNYEKTLLLSRPSYQRRGNDLEFAALTSELKRGVVNTLVIQGTNPVYDHPNKEFKAALKKVKNVIFLDSYANETSDFAQVVIPTPHYLESWGDDMPVLGLYHLSQPVINPVYKTRPLIDTLYQWMGKNITAENAIKNYWRTNVMPKQSKHLVFSSFWKKSLHDGFASLNESNPISLSYDANISKLVSKSKGKGLEISFYESVALRNGSHANNPWLQELPHPISKITWDNYANISPSDAKKYNLKSGDVVSLKTNHGTVKIPVYVQPGQAVGSLSIAIGYGRTKAGKVGNGVGVNVYPISLATVATLTKTIEHVNLAQTQTHFKTLGRPILKETTLDAYHKDPSAGNHGHHDLVMLWDQHKNKGNSWGMAIDLNACTGCSACLVGCQSENNVPVVGREEVLNRREMHWLRIDRYYTGDENNPDVAFQPMMCQHCANAPCESVCPVLATVHSSDGLNQQVYNRCVGTRYCANNCPYKVRRFNWFDYANNKQFDYYMNNNTGRLVLNPDVVVRSRGVMEKCSLCVQRIQEAKLEAKKAGIKVPDNIQPACQQSCPTDAIVFGDMNDPKSRLSKMIKTNKRRYRVLDEINVKPAVNYLTKVRNKA